MTGASLSLSLSLSLGSYAAFSSFRFCCLAFQRKNEERLAAVHALLHIASPYLINSRLFVSNLVPVSISAFSRVQQMEPLMCTRFDNTFWSNLRSGKKTKSSKKGIKSFFLRFFGVKGKWWPPSINMKRRIVVSLYTSSEIVMNLDWVEWLWSVCYSVNRSTSFLKLNLFSRSIL